MKAANQGVAPMPLPGSQAGGFFTNVAQATVQPNGPPAMSTPTATSRPAPVRASVRPEAASGLDGWLMERLFGR
jgi:penicillin-binding protein 1A